VSKSRGNSSQAEAEAAMNKTAEDIALSLRRIPACVVLAKSADGC
jgi:hypothetical protein